MKKPTRDPIEVIVALAAICAIGVMSLWAVTAVARFITWVI